MKKNEKKLSLKKINLTVLDANQLNQLKGGEDGSGSQYICCTGRYTCITRCADACKAQLEELQ